MILNNLSSYTIFILKINYQWVKTLSLFFIIALDAYIYIYIYIYQIIKILLVSIRSIGKFYHQIKYLGFESRLRTKNLLMS